MKSTYVSSRCTVVTFRWLSSVSQRGQPTSLQIQQFVARQRCLVPPTPERTRDMPERRSTWRPFVTELQPTTARPVSWSSRVVHNILEEAYMYRDIATQSIAIDFFAACQQRQRRPLPRGECSGTNLKYITLSWLHVSYCGQNTHISLCELAAFTVQNHGGTWCSSSVSRTTYRIWVDKTPQHGIDQTMP